MECLYISPGKVYLHSEIVLRWWIELQGSSWLEKEVSLQHQEATSAVTLDDCQSSGNERKKIQNGHFYQIKQNIWWKVSYQHNLALKAVWCIFCIYDTTVSSVFCIYSLFVVQDESPVIVGMCFLCVKMTDRWKENLSAFRESKTMCEGLMDEGAADLTLCLRLSQVVSEELAYLRQCVSLRGRVVLFEPLTTRQCW